MATVKKKKDIKKRKTCKECGAKLKGRRKAFCSVDCMNKYKKKNKSKRICKMCGKELTKKSQRGFCSTKCKEDYEESRLNPQQELFCQYYASDREFFGNGLQSYMEAYNIPPKRWKIAAVNASRLLTNAKVLRRINEILEGGNLNDAFVDKQLEFIITQNADLKTKLGGVKEYNLLKARITKKIDHTSGGKPIPILGGITKKDVSDDDSGK